MAVKIRLRRVGKKKVPSYRVVVADGRSPRDGRFIEQIGRYDPLQDPSIVEIDNDRALDWLHKGAQPTDAVRKLLEISGAWGRFRATKGEIHTVGEPAVPPPTKKKTSKKDRARAEAAAEDSADPSADEPPPLSDESPGEASGDDSPPEPEADDSAAPAEEAPVEEAALEAADSADAEAPAEVAKDAAAEQDDPPSEEDAS